MRCGIAIQCDAEGSTPLCAERFAEERLGRCNISLWTQPEVHSIALPVHGTVEMGPSPAHLQVRLVYAPGSRSFANLCSTRQAVVAGVHESARGIRKNEGFGRRVWTLAPNLHVFLDLGRQGYDPARATRFTQRFLERLQGLSHDFSVSEFTIPGRADTVAIEYNHVTPDYLSLLGIPILRGRHFGPAETHEAPGIIVTESTARRLWPGQDPLGKALREISGREYSVIGVAKDAQVAHLGQLDTNYLYFPAGTEDDSRSYVLVRNAGIELFEALFVFRAYFY
jgi:hypothetical protein